MELSQLALFCEIVDSCPIFYTDDPLPLKTLLQAMSPVEKFFGSKLFVLKDTKLDVTQSGNILYPFAKEIVKNADEAQTAVSGSRKGTSILFIGACTGSGNSFLVSTLGEYKKAYPEHNLVLRLHTSSAVIERVQDGLLELGISGYKFGGAELDYKEILEDELVIIVPPKHMFAGREVIALNEVLKEPFIMEQEGSGSRETLLEALALNGAKLSDLNIAMEVGLHESVKTAVISGLGVSILPWLSVEKDVKSGKLKILRLKEGRLSRKFYLINRKNSALSPTAQSFVEFLVNRF